MGSLLGGFAVSGAMMLQFEMIQILSFLLCFTSGVHCLSLDSVSIPTSHPAGQDLTLSCDYSYAMSESDQLVLTWYFNGSPIPIYQWVPALDLGPQVIHELFKDKLDLTYEAEEDKFKKHSDLCIVKPDQRFAGNYKCRVSTFLEEISDSKDVLIYVPPTSISLTNTDGVIRCAVEAVYPVPSVTLAWTVNSTVYNSEEAELTGNTVNGMLFDASVVTDIDQDHAALHDMMTCEVTIDGTDFEKRIEKNILEQIEYSDVKVYLVEDICDSADCYQTQQEASDLADPLDNLEVIESLDSGTGIETLSEEAAAFIASSSSPILVNILLVWGVISARVLQCSL